MVVGGVWWRDCHVDKDLCHSHSQVIVNQIQLIDKVLFDRCGYNVRCFKSEGVDGNLLFCWRERVPNQTWLSPVVCKCGRKLTSEFSRYVAGSGEEPLSSSLIRFHRRSEVECVGRVCRNVGGDVGLCLTITVVVMDRHSWPVHGSLLKVWTSISVKLGIEVRVETSLKDWVIREVDTANNVSRLELCNPLAHENPPY
jgi:hypothetical protein